MKPRYQIRQCEQNHCQFRFPVIKGDSLGKECPQCGGKTEIVDSPYPPHEVKTNRDFLAGLQVEALLDNIRSIFNVGNMIRTADGAGIRHMHLCGITPTPANPKLAKTALGAEGSVAWTYYADGLAAAVSLRDKGYRLWALEGGPRSELFFEATGRLDGPPIVLVVGSEVSGVDPGILEQCERVLQLPMKGIKTTLNVAVAFGVAAYHLRFALPGKDDKEYIMSKKVLVPIADGTEEIEAVCIIDVLRRAGSMVTVASVNELQVTASRGVKLVADKLIADCVAEKYDLIALPGGMPGAEHLRDSKELEAILRNQKEEERLYGAICAAPAVVLQHHGLLDQRRATCHPSFVQYLENTEIVESRVAVDGTCVTSRGPGTALEFALKLVELLYGGEKAKEVAEPMVV